MIKLGVIADDFTGASDAASFLVKSGNKTILLTDVDQNVDNCDCVVVALKIRSVSPEEAISEVKRVTDYFDKLGVEKIYYKYCSTFDSTPKGNIGVVMDYLLERYNCKYSILCPSLPVNGRKVRDGILYVNDVELVKSPLKDHPLNPMWDSYIPNLMKEQSKYKCVVINTNEIDANGISQVLNTNEERIYFVPDYYEDTHAIKIAELFRDNKVLSGGSGLLEYLFPVTEKENVESSFDKNNQKAVIVCGSCSKMTNQQVQTFKNTDNRFVSIEANDLIDGLVNSKEVIKEIEYNLPKTTLVYSNGCEEKVEMNISKAKAMEEFLSELTYEAYDKGFNKIIVAGGETSGAVTLRLGFKSFIVGESVAPGVPVLTPVDNERVRIILKSGNFGDENFFMKAIEAK